MTTDQALETWESLLKPRLSERPPNSKTAEELAAHTGISIPQMVKRIRDLLKAGKLEKHNVAGMRAAVYTIKSVQETSNGSRGRKR